MISDFDSLALGPLHHIAFVVPDLERALAEAATVDGRWKVLRMPGPIQIRTSAGHSSVPLKVAKSRLGSVPIELIEAVAGSPWTPQAHPYVHHFGYWVQPGELARLAQRYEAMGLRREGTRWTDSGAIEGWTYHLWESTGVRIGLVEKTEKAQLEWR